MVCTMELMMEVSESVQVRHDKLRNRMASHIIYNDGATVVNRDGVIGHCRLSQINKLDWLYN